MQVAEALDSLPGNPLVCGSQGLGAAIAGGDSVWSGTGVGWTKVQPGPVIVATTSHQKAMKAQFAKLKLEHPTAKDLKLEPGSSQAPPTPTLSLASILCI